MNDEVASLKEEELPSVSDKNDFNPTQSQQMDETTAAQELEPEFNRDKTLFYLDKVQRKETRDFIKKIDVDNNGKVTESQVVQYIKQETVMTKKAKFFKKTAFWLLLMVFALVISVIILVVYVLNAKTDTLSKNEAVKLLGNVMNEVVNNTNNNSSSLSNFSLTSNEENNVRRVFNSFDVDSDGALNFEEFSDYWLYLKPNKNAFAGIDVDGDKILSYRETVAYLTAIYNIPIAGAIFINMLAVTVEDMYNYSYNYTNPEPIFFEYAADVYFEFFDPDYKGYISHTDYVWVMSGTTFNNEDIDKNGKLSFEEFVGGTFYEEGISFVSNTMSAINVNDFGSGFNPSPELSLNKSDVIGIELHKCPNIFNQMSSDSLKAAQSVQRRRALAPLLALKWAFSTCIDWKWGLPHIDDKCEAAWAAVQCVFSAASTILDCACRECDECTKCNCADCSCDECHCRVPLPGYTWDCNDNVKRNKELCIDSTLSTMGDCLSCLKHKIESNDANAECCFAEHGFVYLKDGTTKELRNVLVGEYVFDGDGYTKVIAVERRGEFKLNMITLYMYHNSDRDVKKSITLTGDHLLYDKHNELIAAEKFVIGDVLFDDYIIYNVLKSEEWPATPITMSGTIYVNDVKASCYIGNERIAAILHDLLAIYRWSSEHINEWLVGKIIESTIAETMWLRINIVEPYNLYWMLEGGSISMAFIVIFGLIGICLKKVIFLLSFEKIMFFSLCGVISFNYQNKR